MTEFIGTGKWRLAAIASSHVPKKYVSLHATIAVSDDDPELPNIVSTISFGDLIMEAVVMEKAISWVHTCRFLAASRWPGISNYLLRNLRSPISIRGFLETRGSNNADITSVPRGPQCQLRPRTTIPATHPSRALCGFLLVQGSVSAVDSKG